MRFQNSPQKAFPGQFKMQNSKEIAKFTPEEVNFPQLSECEVLSAGHATAMNKI